MYLFGFLMVIFCLFYIKILQKNKSLMLSVGLCFFVEIIWALLSIFYLDMGGIYVYETGITTFHTGAAIRMLILLMPMIFVTSRKYSGKISGIYKQKLYFKKLNNEKCMFYILVFGFMVIMYCIIDMFISGVPLFSSSIGRINFSNYSKLPFATKINGEDARVTTFISRTSKKVW